MKQETAEKLLKTGKLSKQSLLEIGNEFPLNKEIWEEIVKQLKPKDFTNIEIMRLATKIGHLSLYAFITKNFTLNHLELSRLASDSEDEKVYSEFFYNYKKLNLSPKTIILMAKEIKRQSVWDNAVHYVELEEYEPEDLYTLALNTIAIEDSKIEPLSILLLENAKEFTVEQLFDLGQRIKKEKAWEQITKIIDSKK